MFPSFNAEVAADLAALALAERIISFIKNDMNWTQVAADLDYNSQRHFSNDFKKIIGKSPSEYAKSIRRAH